MDGALIETTARKLKHEAELNVKKETALRLIKRGKLTVGRNRRGYGPQFCRGGTTCGNSIGIRRKEELSYAYPSAMCENAGGGNVAENRK